MKQCAACSKFRSVSEFFKTKRSTDGYASYCKSCANTKSAASRHRNPMKAALNRAAAATKLRDRYQQYKRERGCKFCSEREPVCLELHHTDPTFKQVDPNKLWNRKWDVFLQEAQKCMVVCSNCHKKLHAKILICSTSVDGDTPLS